MSAYVRALAQQTWISRILFYALMGSFAVIAGLVGLAYELRKDVRVNVRPGVSTSVVTREGEMPAENVFNLCYVVFQQLNRWDQDGGKDYQRQISAYRAYLSDRFRGQLNSDAEQRKSRGELQYRTRSMSLPPGVHFTSDRVKQLSETVWIVYLDLDLTETASGQVIKNPVIRYPIRVVAADVDAQKNTQGLVLDGFADEPHRLSTQEMKDLGISIAKE